jgi:hypothetical protein
MFLAEVQLEILVHNSKYESLAPRRHDDEEILIFELLSNYALRYISSTSI